MTRISNHHSLTQIESQILILRGENIMLDSTLAKLYQVETRTLIQAVKRNIDRFPADFMFQLTQQEFSDLKSHSVMSSSWGGRRTRPYAFTEQGVAMLSSVLKSKRAVQANIEIIRTFVRLREILSTNKELSARLKELEQTYDQQFKVVFDAIRQILSVSETSKKNPMGFVWPDKE